MNNAIGITINHSITPHIRWNFLITYRATNKRKNKVSQNKAVLVQPSTNHRENVCVLTPSFTVIEYQIMFNGKDTRYSNPISNVTNKESLPNSDRNRSNFSKRVVFFQSV